MRNHKKFNVNLCGPITDKSIAPKVKWSLMHSVMQMDIPTLNESAWRTLRVSATIIFIYWGNSWKIFSLGKKVTRSHGNNTKAACMVELITQHLLHGSTCLMERLQWILNYHHQVKIDLLQGIGGLEQPADLERIWAFSMITLDIMKNIFIVEVVRH